MRRPPSGTVRVPSRWPRAVGLTIVGVWSALQLAHAGTLASLSLSGASAGVSFSIVGTGFNATAASNVVTFTSADNTSVSAPAASVGAADPSTGARRLTLTIPTGVKIGTTRVSVTNTPTGEVSDTRTFEVIGLSLPNTTFAAPASTAVAVRIVGSPNTNFLSGTARASFGTGVTVTATNVESATSLVAIINVPANAALGTRDVGVTTGTQTAILSKGFTIGTAPANQAPRVDAGQDQTITLPANASLQGNVTDDGLPVGSVLTRAWTKESGPGPVTFGDPNAEATSATFGAEGTYVLRLTASDTALSAFDELTVTVQPAPPVNRPPVASDDSAATNFQTPLSVVAPGVLANDSDPDPGDTIAAQLATGPSHATSFALNADGSFAYTPTAGFSGPDSFTYRAVDQQHAQSNVATVSITVATRPNQPPHFTSSPVLTGGVGQPYSYQAAAIDADNDPLTFSLTQFPSGMGMSATGLITWTPTAVQTGPQIVTVHVDDGRGGSDTQPFTVNVTAPITLESLELAPASARFSAKNATRSLTLTGRRSDQTTLDLTAPSTGTTYESSNPFVATVSAEGVVTSVADGESTITARNSGLSATAAMVVEVGVTLDSLDLSPSAPTLRSPNATQALTLRGHFSDQTTRDLTNTTGVTFRSDNEQVATVTGDGRVTALANGSATITGALDTKTATANVTVAISGGTGFLTGRVFDDTRGQPLGGATIDLLTDGGGALDASVTVVADAQGRFVVAGRAGAAIVRVTKDGFTTVERRGEIPVGSSARLLDARLTPIDPRANAVVSAFGGAAHDADNQATLQLPPGTLPADASLRITRVSPQGLAGRLPLGWSPVAAADIVPGTMSLAQGATLRLPNTASLAANATVTIATYDPVLHDWIARASGHVSADARQFEIPLDRSGQVVALVPDAAPFVPPSANVAELLQGVSAPVFPIDASVNGDVVPRSAPPGDNVRAVGRVSLQSASPLPSGTALSVHVTEQFDLLDSSRVVPLPFTEDILVHARPRPPTDGPLGATFPITPSRNYTLQELLLGVVKLDVDPSSTAAGGTVIGGAGGSLADADGDTLDVPAGALGVNALVNVTRLAPNELTVAVPANVDLLVGVSVDLIGASFTQPASLSIARASGLADDAQVIVAQAFSDPQGVRRLRVVGVGRLDAGRIVSQPASGALSFNGVDGGGEYVFLRPQTPLGFVAGRVFGAGGSTPRALALVTADGSPFADLTPSTGRYVVAAAPSPAVHLQATDTASHDAAGGTVAVAARDAVAALDLTLTVVVPTITSTSPANGDKNIALDTSVAITFSEEIDPGSISDASVQLQLGGSPVTLVRTLSADRRRLVLRPQSPLTGKSTYALVVTNAVRDSSGNSLAPFIPVSFTTFDPSKPPQPEPGRIVAQLPDEDGLVLVFGAGGSAEGSSPVTITNLRTQETATVLADADGSFRVRLGAIVGDELALTFRDASGRETTSTIAQFDDVDGTTSVGVHGGSITEPGGRVATILPRSLTTAGLFKLTAADASPSEPVLPLGFSYADRLALTITGAAFNRLTSITLTESQGRFAPQSAGASPFSAAAQITVPADFLTNATLRFTATAQDVSGDRESVSATTMVVAASADGTPAEASQTAQFPTVFVTAPQQALANQQVLTTAIAPSARVDVQLPVPGIADTAAAVLLTRLVDLAGESKLSVVDRLEVAGQGADRRLHTTGRELPGATVSGEYAIVTSASPLVFLTGRVTGPAAVVTIDGLPFAFETDGPNGSFQLPALASQAFTLRFFSKATGESLGTTSGLAPASGTTNLGSPLASAAGTLSVSVDPIDGSVVDIAQPITFTFSEPIDVNSIGANGVIVTDAAASRIFGTVAVSADSRIVTFKPLRRLRYAMTYRWGVATNVLAQGGARLSAPANGQFTTFTPSVVGTAAFGTATAVAANATIAVVGTAAGFSVLDVSAPAAPQPLVQQLVDGGVNGLALVTGPITTRSGQTLTGTFGIVAAGSQATAARLLIFDLSTPAAPVLIGSTQLTKTPGAAAVAGVPDVVGTPTGVIVTADSHAIVPTGDAGVFSVAIGDAIPLDAGNPGLGLVARLAMNAGESARDVGLLGGRLVVATTAGLAVLDPATLARSSTLPVTAQRLAGGSAFSMDANGDGALSAGETFDLLVVSGGADGTVQFYRVPAAGDPALVTVVRFTGETTGVSLDATERLAYVALGSRGVGIVDLDGPASIQPLDDDHDGLDDRILGVVDTPGNAIATSLVRSRGLAFVADGPGGLTIAQVLPARTRFLTLRRDPIPGETGDEESILDSRQALVTDGAIDGTLDVTTDARGALTLAIDERPNAGGVPQVSFADGSLSQALHDGLNSFLLALAPNAAATGGQVTLRVRNSSGQQVTSLTVTLATANLSDASISQLEITPDTIVVDDENVTAQVSVKGIRLDGSAVNLTAASSGTTYAVGDARVADVTPDGLVVAVAGGQTELVARSHGRSASALIKVPIAPALASFEVVRPFMTLTALGQAESVDIVARLTDQSLESSLSLIGATFSSSNPAVATVDADGVVTAVSDGVTTITVRNGSIVADVQIAVESRITPTLTAISIDAIAAPLGTDKLTLVPTARIVGAGSLDGVPVTFDVAGGGSASAETDDSGVAMGLVTAPAIPGLYTVRATVTNPTGGNVLTAQTSFVVEAAGSDSEPNDSLSSAPKIAARRAVTGSLGGGDTRDVFRSESTVPGVLRVDVTLPSTADLANIRVVFTNAAGQELARLTPTSRSQRFTQSVPAGPTFVSIETTNGAALTYSLTPTIDQAPVVITGVAPLSGGPGTAVTITGTGFSTDPSQTTVYFGGAMAKVASTSATEIQAQVPAFAIDGPVTVVSFGNRGVGPQFTVGATILPRPTLAYGDTAGLREDPVTGTTVDVSRLIVFFDPTVVQPDANALLASRGGTIIGSIPSLNAYIAGFAGNATLAGINTIARDLRTSPLVRRVNLDRLVDLAQSIDTRDSGLVWTGTNIPIGVAYAQARVFEAIDAIRRSPAFAQDGATFAHVNVAVLDTGFNPVALGQTQFQGQNTVTELFSLSGASPFNPRTFFDPDGHGTEVTSIIGAVNDGVGMSGGLNGLFRSTEQPVSLQVYAIADPLSGKIKDDIILGALADLAGRQVDVANLSFGGEYAGPSQALEDDKQSFRDAFALSGGQTLFVAAAGNDGLDASFFSPAALADELPYVMSIGATAVANLDGSGEGADARAIFNKTVRFDGQGVDCRQGRVGSESNCGSSVTLAAPGEDIIALAAIVGSTTPASDLTSFSGTSGAAPIVTAIVGLLQSIRGNGHALAPSFVRDLLVETADDISDVWGAGPMRRINALAAVRKLLPPAAPQMIYVSDQEAINTSGPPGAIHGINIDPLTGAQSAQTPNVSIPLTFTKLGVTFNGTKPTALIMSPIGDRLYAVVDGGAHVGYGLLVVNTLGNVIEDFIPFSGAVFAVPQTGAQPPPPVPVGTLRPALAFSKDGRILYVGIDAQLLLVNIVERKLIRTAADLPAPYRPKTASPDLASRLATLNGIIAQGIATPQGTRPGTSIAGLAMSPGGDVLFIAVSTGGGGGRQPGGLLAVNVYLYKDSNPQEPGLQADLSRFLTASTPTVVAQSDAGGFTGGDEPSGVAINPLDNRVYLPNGGMEFFQAIPPDDLDLNDFFVLLEGAAFTAANSASGISGLIASVLGFGQSSLYQVLLEDVEEQARSGITFIGAPGPTAVFDVSATALTESWLFPSEVTFGWSPSAAAGGGIVNQTRFFDVFAKRPFGMAIRPGGARAIVPYFQTGNFGVLDLDTQKSFSGSGFSALPATVFSGVSAVTPTVRLDTHLWPKRGAFDTTAFMPSPDENLLFTWDVAYAQNGRFAVGSHAGNGLPRQVTAALPDFVNDTDAHARLLDLGATFDANGVSWHDDGGAAISGNVGANVTLQRGGGALTIINDDAVAADLTAHAADVITFTGGATRPYFATVPITASAVTTVTKFSTDQSPTVRLHRPRGVAIQPFVSFEGPRWGDHVAASTAVEIVWRETTVDSLSIELIDGDTNNSINTFGASFNAPVPLSFSVPFKDLFPPQQKPVQNKSYFLVVHVAAGMDEVSTESLLVTFDDLSGPIHATPGDSIQLRPVLVPFVTVPTATPKALTVTFTPADGSAAQNITADAQTTYLWLGDCQGNVVQTSNPFVNKALELADIDVCDIIQKLKTKLSEAGVPVDFKLANLSIDASGHLSVLEPGLNVVEAVYFKNGEFLFSAPTLVIGGLQLTKIDLEPSSLLNTAAAISGADTLVKKVATKLGKKVNTPLILTPAVTDTFSFIGHEGEIELNDVEFTYLGSGKISLNQFLEFIEPIVRKELAEVLAAATAEAGGIGALAAPLAAKGIVALLHEGIGEAGIRLVHLKSADTTIATVADDLLFKGDVTAAGPGITSIKGELDLGDFGTAKDAVPVFVLPQLSSAVLDPINILLCSTESPTPGRKLKTIATLKFTPHVSMSLADIGIEDETAQQVAEQLIPAVLPFDGSFFDKRFDIGDFEFGFSGSITADGGTITWNDPSIVFTVPNLDVPLVGKTTDYRFDDPTIAGLDPNGNGPLSVRVVHFHQIGKTRVLDLVHLPGLGSVQALGSVTVTSLCSTSFVMKESDLAIQTATTTDQLTWTATVGNPTDEPLTDATVQDAAEFIADPPTGAADDVVDVTQLIPVGTIPPHASIEVQVLIPAMGRAGTIWNSVLVANASAPVVTISPCQVNPQGPGCQVPPPPPPPQTQPPPPIQKKQPPQDCVVDPKRCAPVVVTDLGLPIIFEMVLRPQQDWNDSAGGNGIPFDATPGNGTVNQDDVWIEVTSGTTATTNWSIELEDATGAVFTKLLGPPITTSQTKILSGFGLGTSPVVTVRVRDQSGVVRQTIDITALESIWGQATSPANESFTYSVYGSPTLPLQQFVPRPSTIGVYLPF